MAVRQGGLLGQTHCANRRLAENCGGDHVRGARVCPQLPPVPAQPVAAVQAEPSMITINYPCLQPGQEQWKTIISSSGSKLHEAKQASTSANSLDIGKYVNEYARMARMAQRKDSSGSCQQLPIKQTWSGKKI